MNKFKTTVLTTAMLSAMSTITMVAEAMADGPSPFVDPDRKPLIQPEVRVRPDCRNQGVIWRYTHGCDDTNDGSSINTKKPNPPGRECHREETEGHDGQGGTFKTVCTKKGKRND